MLITIDSINLYHVVLVDLKHEGQTLRSFATSEQLIAWLKLHPGDYTLVTNVRGTQLLSDSSLRNLTYGSYRGYSIPESSPKPEPLDILCDWGITVSQDGSMTQSQHTSAGWG